MKFSFSYPYFGCLKRQSMLTTAGIPQFLKMILAIFEATTEFSSPLLTPILEFIEKAGLINIYIKIC